MVYHVAADRDCGGSGCALVATGFCPIKPSKPSKPSYDDRGGFLGKSIKTTVRMGELHERPGRSRPGKAEGQELYLRVP